MRAGFYIYKMKELVLVLIIGFCVKMSAAQKEQLSLDEHDNYIYYQVVDMPGLSKDTLATRELHFLKRTYPGLKAVVNTNQIIANGKFLIYDGTSILKHESGEIAYLLTIECKDQKYRYWLTRFTFTPYHRDRYGNFVPEPGKEIPLEKAPSKLNKKDADACLTQTADFCKEFGEKLKLSLSELRAPKKAMATNKVVTDNW